MQDSSHQLSLKLMQRCPACYTGLMQGNIQIIRETEHTIFAHITCQRCNNQYLTKITSGEQGIVGNAIITDLSYVETMRLIDEQPISEDTFLAIYRSIKQQTLIESFQLEPKSRKEL